MIVHFPIAFAYLLIIVEGVAIMTRQRTWERAGFALLTLEIFALLAAMVAGVISSHAVQATGASASLLAAHKRDAVLTGLAFGALWIWRSGLLFPARSGGGLSDLAARRRHPGAFSFLLLLIGVIMVSITGSLGGSMVYGHGLGVHSMTHTVIEAHVPNPQSPKGLPPSQGSTESIQRGQAASSSRPPSSMHSPPLA